MMMSQVMGHYCSDKVSSWGQHAVYQLTQTHGSVRHCELGAKMAGK